MNDEVQKVLQQSREEMFRAVSKSPYEAAELILHLRRRNEPVPEFLLQSVVSVDAPLVSVADNTVLARKLAEDYVTTEDEVPQILLNKVAESDKDSYYLALHYKKFDQQVPEVILQSVLKSPRWSSVFSSKIREMSGDEDEEKAGLSLDDESRKQAIDKILQDEGTALQYVELLMRNKKEIPLIVQKAFESEPRLAKEYASTILGLGGKVPDSIINELTKDAGESYAVGEYILTRFKNVAPESIVRAIAKNALLASHYASAILKEKIINHNYLKILEHGITQGDTKEELRGHRVYGFDTEKDSEKTNKENRIRAADDYAIVYSRILGEIPPPEIMRFVSDVGITYVASNLASLGKKVPVEFINKIAAVPDQSYRFVGRYYLKHGTRQLPKEYKKIMMAAKKYEKERI